MSAVRCATKPGAVVFQMNGEVGGAGGQGYGTLLEDEFRVDEADETGKVWAQKDGARRAMP